MFEIGTWDAITVGISVNCGCKSSWNIVNGELVQSFETKDCVNHKALYVEGKCVVINSAEDGFSILVKGLVEEDIPQQIKDEMALDNFTVAVHEIKSIDSLKEFIVKSGYYPDRYKDFLLLVKYEEKIPVSLDDAEEWAHNFLGHEDPYFVYVDNTHLVDDVAAALNASGNNVNRQVILRKAAFPEMDEKLEDVSSLFKDLVDQLQQDLEIDVRKDALEALYTLENQVREHINRLFYRT